MKTKLCAVLFLFLPFPAAAQLTTVTGTVKGTDGIAYAGGQIKMQLVTTAGSPVSGQPTVTVNNQAQCVSGGFGSAPCQVPFQGTVGPLALSPTGTFTINLQDNTLVTPAATQWLFTANSTGSPPPIGTGPQVCTAQFTISGPAQAVAGNLAACPALSNVASGGGTSVNITSTGAVPGKAVNDGTMNTTAATFSANGNSTSPATPAGTTTFNNEVVVSMYSINAAFTAPGTPTLRAAVPFAAATNEGVWMGDQTVTSAGAYAANTGTVAASSWAAAAIPMIPIAGSTISFTVAATGHTTGSSLSVVFAATAGQTLIACIAAFGGATAGTVPSNWNLIVVNSNGSQVLTCYVHRAGPGEGSYTFGGLGTFMAVAIAEYANVAAIDNTLTSATANWSAADNGKTLCAEGFNSLSAGFLACTPVALITSPTTMYPLFTNTQASAVSTSALMWGVDSTVGFTGALTGFGSAGGTIAVPPGVFFMNAGQFKLPFNVNVNILGAGAQATIGPGGIQTPVPGAGGSFIIGLADAAGDPIIGSVQGPGTGLQIFQTNDLIQGITIRANKTGGTSCIAIAMEFVTIQKNDLIGCFDAIGFFLNNTVYTGLNTVRDNFIEYSTDYAVNIATGSLGSNYWIERNEMDFNTAGGIKDNGAEQITITNNQIQFGGDAITVSGTGGLGDVALTIGPGNWIAGTINYTSAGGSGPTIWSNTFEASQLIKLNGQNGATITGNNFQVGTPFSGASTQTNLTMDATNTGGGFTQSFTGTSGTASCVYSVTGGQTRAACFLNGYANTGAAQTWTYPLPMATTPFLTESGGSCGGFNPSTSATVLTLPANAAMAAETCQIIAEGQTN